MLAKVNSSAVLGLDAVSIEVEVDIASQGLPSFTIVGLPDKAVEEAKERVRSAIKNSGADFPAKRITVNLAPADLQKEGPSYDLPIALGILLASEQLKVDVSNSLFIGELSLDGALRHVNGVLPQVLFAQKQKIKKIFLPLVNAKEAALIKNTKIYGIPSLHSLFQHLTSQKTIVEEIPLPINKFLSQKQDYDFDFADIKGQEQAKRAMEIGASGGHNMLLKGPPGSGKTLTARTLPSILPHFTFEEALEVTKIYSITGLLEKDTIITKRPFRAPHHTTSHIGLVGGGTHPKPGEVSLAHRGVLFLDEFPEFPRQVLEMLRQPMEDGYVTISRAKGRLTFPTKFMLVAAQNPCPCGFFGDAKHTCVCLPSQILRYKKKVSGPILDRIDIHLDVPAVKVEKLTSQDGKNAESSKVVRKRVQKARNIQLKRFRTIGITTNSEMTNRQLKELCPLSSECLVLLRSAITKLNLSARSYHRIIKLARTIGDLEEAKNIQVHHIAEALQYRPRFESIY